MAKKKKQTFEEKPKSESIEVKRWIERIHTALHYRDQVAEENRWNTFIEEYKGKYDVTIGNRPIPPVNEVYAFVQAAISNLFFRDPKFSVNPERGADIRGAKLWEQVLNYYWRVLGNKEEIESEIIDAILVGHGWHKTGYSVVTSGENDNLRILDEKPFSIRTSWKDVVFNIGARKPPKDCQWIAVRLIMPTMDIKEKYPKAKELRGTKHPDINQDMEKNVHFKDDINFSTLWQIYDSRAKEILLIADGLDKVLERKKWPKYLNSYPLHMLWFNRINDEAYPMSDIAPWEPQILEKIKLWGMVLDHIKRWNRQLLVKKNFMSPDALDKFERGIDGSILEVNGNPQADTRELQFGPLPPDIYLILDKLDQVKNVVNGQPEVNKGAATQTKSRTLGELEFIVQGARSRTDRKVDRIETHCENIARQILAHIKANFDEEEDIVVKITGTPTEELQEILAPNFDPVSNTIQFKPSDIAGEYDVTVKKGSTLPLNSETKRALLAQILEALPKLLAAGTLPRFVQVVILELLEEFGMKELEKAFEEHIQAQEQQAILEQRSQNLEDAKAEADVERKKAQAGKIQQDAVVSSTKAVTDAADKGLSHIEGGNNGV